MGELPMRSYAATLSRSVSLQSRPTHSQTNSTSPDLSAGKRTRSFSSRQRAWFRAALAAWIPPSVALAMSPPSRRADSESCSVEEAPQTNSPLPGALEKGWAREKNRRDGSNYGSASGESTASPSRAPRKAAIDLRFEDRRIVILLAMAALKTLSKQARRTAMRQRPCWMDMA